MQLAQKMLGRVKVVLFLLLAGAQAFSASFSLPDAKNHPDLFAWTDSCNIYVLRDGDAALLINLGDGSVLERKIEGLEP